MYSITVLGAGSLKSVSMRQNQDAGRAAISLEALRMCSFPLLAACRVTSVSTFVVKLPSRRLTVVNLPLLFSHKDARDYIYGSSR